MVREVIGPGDVVDGRYRLGGLLGEGGMASVFEAHDVSSDERIALKRLRPAKNPRQERHMAELFEREFYTLAQLSHPRIVEVRDYGVDEEGPYYTMELLSGGDLGRLAPLAWQRACALIRDVCSALSLVHSRRMVHRDMSARNIRITADGSAKLIDFGGMTPMGPAKHLVGTPPLCAPEALDGRSLDARTDLYSLGATLYFVLVGQHAYPVQGFRQLRRAWGLPPVPPSRLVRDVPPALDELVLSLLQLDAEMRPNSAAEVLERLSAIADLPADEQQPVAEAYLVMPTLVGRDGLLARAREAVRVAMRRSGDTLLVAGAPGTGKSRLLDACALEAKLEGATVLRAGAGSAGTDDYATARMLAEQLLSALPEPAPKAAGSDAALIACVVPELSAPGGAAPDAARIAQLRPRLQAALREWLVAVSERHPLLIAVDDVDAIDEPSAALLSLLAHAARRCRMVVLASADASLDESSAGSLQLLLEHSTRLPIGNLDASESAELLRSVFGNVPHLQRAAERIYRVSDGNPRDVMELSQHLVECGAARYAAGSWSLPARIDERDLPSSIEQALRLRVESLDADARELAQAMGLTPDGGLGFAQCQLLAGHDSPGRLVQSLDRLVAAGVVQIEGERYVLRQQGWAGVLQQALEAEGAERVQHLNGKLAELHRNAGDDLRVARHLWRAGRVDEAIDVLVAHAAASERETDESFEVYLQVLASQPPDWAEIYQSVMRACIERGRPQRELFILRSRYCSLTSPNGLSAGEAMTGVLEQLGHACGLDLHATLDPSLPASERTQRMLALAEQRYAHSPEAMRVLPPGEAIQPLARAVLSAIGPIAIGQDHAECIALPSLTPLLPLSPAIAIVQQLVDGVTHRLAGRIERARETYAAVLERAAEPDRAGLDPTYHRQLVHAVVATLGRLEATLGLATPLERAAFIERSSIFTIPALMVRVVYHLWQGDARRAEACKEQAELLSIQHRPPQFAEANHLLAEIAAHAAAEDLTRVKQSVAGIEPMSRRFRGWAPILDYARGEYHRVRGDGNRALEAHARALSQVAAGRHQMWGEIAAAHVTTLSALRRDAEAVAAGEAALHDAAREGLAHAGYLIRLPLSLALARVGRGEEAERACEAVIAYLGALGSSGLLVGLALETRARIAIERGDHAGFDRYAARCGEQLRGGDSRALSKKHERLLQEARLRRVGALGGRTTASRRSARPPTEPEVVASLDACQGAGQRAQSALALLIEHSGAAGGFLYGLSAEGPKLLSHLGRHAAPSGLTMLVADCLTTQAGSKDTTATSVAAVSTAPERVLTGAQGEQYRSVLLAHPSEEGFTATAVAVLVVEDERAFVYQGPLAINLSRALLGYGDVVGATLP